MKIHFKKEIKVSSKSLRTFDSKDNAIVIGAHDKKLYLVDLQTYDIIKTIDVLDTIPYSVKFINNNQIAVGCDDKSITIVNMDNIIVSKLEGHTSRVNSLSYHNSYLASGSWDATCKIWDLSTNELITALLDHTHSVTVCFLSNGDLLTGSQNGFLQNFKAKEFSLIKKVEAHHDIIRSIREHNNTIITASNDNTVKVWDFNIDLLYTFKDHSLFVFTAEPLKHNNIDLIISGGEDFRLCISEKGKLIDDIGYCCTIWGIHSINEWDIGVMGEDGKLNIFTLNPKDFDESRHSDYIEQADLAYIKDPSLTEEDLKRFPKTCELSKFTGYKNGCQKVFIDNGEPKVYQWNDDKWNFSGENKSSGMVNYEGDAVFPQGFYNYVFMIQIDDNTICKLPYNNTDNLLFTIDKFIMREKITAVCTQDIIDFILYNTKSVQSQKNGTLSSKLKLIQELVPANMIIHYYDIDYLLMQNDIKTNDNNPIIDETISEPLNHIIQVLDDPLKLPEREIEREQRQKLIQSFISILGRTEKVFELIKIYLLHPSSSIFIYDKKFTAFFFNGVLNKDNIVSTKNRHIILQLICNLFKHNGIAFHFNIDVICKYFEDTSKEWTAEEKVVFLNIIINYHGYSKKRNLIDNTSGLVDIFNSLEWSFVTGNHEHLQSYVVCFCYLLSITPQNLKDNLKTHVAVLEMIKSPIYIELKGLIVDYLED